MVQDSLALRNHLVVRDTLRTSTELLEEYASVKRSVGASAANIDDYVRGKNAVIQKILAAAGVTERDRLAIENENLPSS